MSTLAAPLGNTPQGTQVAAGNQQLLSSAGNSVQSGQTLDPATMNAAQTLYNTTAQNQASTQTPGARQGYLDNTNIASQQGNYDALAKQLASYDQMVLQPQFQGSNPGAPSELNGLSGYVNPNLSYNSADARTPDQALYNANPMYGLNRQADQGNSIVSLLGTLNTLLSNESKRGTAKYTSDLGNMSSMLSTLNNIFGQNTNLTMEKARLADAKAARDAAAKDKELTPLQQKQLVLNALKSAQGKDFHVSPTDYSRIKNELSSLGIDSKDFDTWGQGYRNPDQATLFPTDTYEVNPTSLTATEQKSIQKAKDAQDAVVKLNGFADQIFGNWQQMGPEEKAISVIPGANKIGLLAPNIVKNDAIFYDNLIDGLRAKIGGRLTQQDIKWLHNQLPNVGDSEDTARYKIEQMKGGVVAKQNNPDAVLGNSNPTPNPSGTSGSAGSTIMTGPDGKRYQVPNGKVGLFQQNGYK